MQQPLQHFNQFKQVYIPYRSNKSKKGLSEKTVRSKLERSNYLVWRGGSINMLDKDELYPNVERKYRLLIKLLKTHHPHNVDDLKYFCKIHHGMPDFIVYKNAHFKLIECKLQYEPLSKRQRKCFIKLHNLGFQVEIHRLVDHRTKTTKAKIDMFGNKTIQEKQFTVQAYARSVAQRS